MSNIQFLDILPNSIGYDLRLEIFSNLGGESTYWKELFGHTIISQIDPREYFSKKVLSEIDKGWRLVGFNTQIGDQYSSEDVIDPCLNCYWYNSDPHALGDICNCSEHTKLVSWNHIIDAYPSLKRYPRYYDFLRSKEWNAHLRMSAFRASF